MPDLRLTAAPLEVNPAAHYTLTQQPSIAETACAAALSRAGADGIGEYRKFDSVRRGRVRRRELLSGACAYRN